jgi:hypothetical protein
MEARQDLALVEAKKSLLGGTDLMDVHVIVSSGHAACASGSGPQTSERATSSSRARLSTCSKSCGVAISVDNRLGSAAFGQHSRATRRALLFGPTNRQMAVTGLRPSTGSDERLDELPVRLEADETVADARR